MDTGEPVSLCTGGSSGVKKVEYERRSTEILVMQREYLLVAFVANRWRDQNHPFVTSCSLYWCRHLLGTEITKSE